jgi:hypothetical protein
MIWSLVTTLSDFYFITIILIYFQVRMAGNPEAVSKFLSGLAVKLQPLWKEEKAEMLKLKEEEVHNHT